MAVEKEKTIEDFEKQPSAVDALIQDHKHDTQNRDFQKAKPRLFILAVLLSMILLVGFYLLSSFSKIKSISVHGNYYLESSYITKVSGLSLNTVYLFTNPWQVEKTLKEDGMIQDCSVKMLGSNVVAIEVVENKAVGYRYEEEPMILMADGSQVPLKSEYLSIISKIPLVTGFTSDNQTYLLTKAFSEIDQSIIENIAEVNQYELKYDAETLKILMRDGGYFISSYYGLPLINQYNQYSEKLTNRDYCIYADDAQRVAYSTLCPWDQVETVLEYWTDENGNPITNKYGDKAVKHYYSDSEGLKYLDEEGNPIIIPIDMAGNEVKDADFLNHFEAGYYATGTLVIPEETPDPEASASPDASASPETEG